MKEQHGLAGRVWISLTDPQTGAIVEEYFVKNEILLDGRKLLAQLFSGSGNVKELRIIIGTGDTDVAPNQKLSNITKAADAPARTEIQPDKENDTQAVVTVTANFLALASGASPQKLTEAGIILVSDNKGTTLNTLYNRVKFDVINRSSSLAMTFRWEVIF